MSTKEEENIEHVLKGLNIPKDRYTPYITFNRR